MGDRLGEIKQGYSEYPDREMAPEARNEHITLPELHLLRHIRGLQPGNYMILVERASKGKYSNMEFTVQEVALP